MKHTNWFTAVAGLAFLFTTANGRLLAEMPTVQMENSPAGAAVSAPSIADGINNIVRKISAKLQQGKTTEADLVDNIREFDALLAEHKSEKTDEVAAILVVKAKLYIEVLNDFDKAADVYKVIKSEFPLTETGKGAGDALESLQAAGEKQRVQKSLAEGAVFPDFNEKDVNGKPLSIGGYKGKVVLVDFWATWCGPCRAELPNVIETYKKYHANGFEIVGISLDQDQAKLENYTKAQQMTWPQYFDGKGWGNKLAGKYGINSIPATYLLDREGKIIAKGLRGEALGEAVAKALAVK